MTDLCTLICVPSHHHCFIQKLATCAHEYTHSIVLSLIPAVFKSIGMYLEFCDYSKNVYVAGFLSGTAWQSYMTRNT